MTAPGTKGKERIDAVLVDRGLLETRQQARAALLAGEVRVDGHPVTKPGTMVPPSAAIEVARRPQYVSRGGEKLAHALDVLRRHCERENRDYGTIEKTILHVGAPPMTAADAGPFAEAMAPYAGLGVSRVIVMPAGPDPAGFVRTLSAHVVPRLAEL